VKAHYLNTTVSPESYFEEESMTRRALLATPCVFGQSKDWQSILALSITHDEDNFQLLRSYVFELYDVFRPARHLRQSQAYEINLIGPGMYFRKTKLNDLPLSPADKQIEQKRLNIHLGQAQNGEATAIWRKERDLLALYLKTHEFKFKGEKKIDGRMTLILESKPPKSASADLAFLTNANCRLLIDRETGHWVEAVCQVNKRTQFELNQLLLGRLSLPYSPGLINRGDMAAGSVFSFRLQRLEDGLWVPKSYRQERTGFVSEMTFSNFRRFGSESQLLTDPA